jgi:hypothetical protein
MKKASEDEELTSLKLKNAKKDKYSIQNELAHKSSTLKVKKANNISDKRLEKKLSKSALTLEECQFCVASKRNTDNNFRKYEEKCLNCAKILCEKCSILSSININKNLQKICVLCKTCSKIDDLNLDIINNNELNYETLSSQNVKKSNISLNEEIVTIDLNSSQVCFNFGLYFSLIKYLI